MKRNGLNSHNTKLGGLLEKIRLQEDLMSLHPQDQIKVLMTAKGFTHGKNKKNKRRK